MKRIWPEKVRRPHHRDMQARAATSRHARMHQPAGLMADCQLALADALCLFLIDRARVCSSTLAVFCDSVVFPIRIPSHDPFCSKFEFGFGFEARFGIVLLSEFRKCKHGQSLEITRNSQFTIDHKTNIQSRIEREGMRARAVMDCVCSVKDSGAGQAASGFWSYARDVGHRFVARLLRVNLRVLQHKKRAQSEYRNTKRTGSEHRSKTRSQ